ncbi:MAG: hypothetical protein Q8Q59_08170 [Luteolibacter sp.]|jgi:hypothetical protein|nr:hypothetical protein [Luteolibacter sp.]
MKIPSFQFLQQITPTPIPVSSPSLDSMSHIWEHIAERFLGTALIDRIQTGRIRSLRLLAVHDAVSSIIDPGFGNIYQPSHLVRSTHAALAATARTSHDILAAFFNDPSDREDLAHTLEEVLSLFGNEPEKKKGLAIGAESAEAYLSAFSGLIPAKTTFLLRHVAA